MFIRLSRSRFVEAMWANLKNFICNYNAPIQLYRSSSAFQKSNSSLAASKFAYNHFHAANKHSSCGTQCKFRVVGRRIIWRAFFGISLSLRPKSSIRARLHVRYSNTFEPEWRDFSSKSAKNLDFCPQSLRYRVGTSKCTKWSHHESGYD